MRVSFRGLFQATNDDRFEPCLRVHHPVNEMIENTGKVRQKEDYIESNMLSSDDN